MLDLYILETCAYCKKVLAFLEEHEIKFNPINIKDKANEETRNLGLGEDITDEVEVLIKYDGYIKRQEQQVETSEKLEKYRIPANIDYSQIKHISTETKEKLEKIRPTNLAQASRIGGVKPADISVLMVLLGK